MKKHPTILMIDDDSDDQEIFGFALEKVEDQVNCVYANDGIQALEKINSDTQFLPDFIFIDMNMPKMNGQQCLSEIKKIERLKDVPVYMYSTSADPFIIEENKKLGAVDVIIKPSDINILSKILSNIIKSKVMPMMMMFFLMMMIIPEKGFSQKDSVPPIKELKKLSVEELMNVMVTSVSKTPEKLSEVASAIQVVTGDEIKRSGTLRLPTALRLATNLSVVTAGSHDQGISARGFNGNPLPNSSLADKLLVLIDGRTVYTPLFGGVFWDVQNVITKDLKQIEVISGPGGTLWGANAVNGIINIISKSAKETQGVYVSAAGGNRTRDFLTARYGSQIDSTFFYRVYAQRFDITSGTKPDGSSSRDAWDMTQLGFRTDYIPSDKKTVTLQGDFYTGTENDTASTTVNGQNLLGRYSYSFSEKSGLTVQTYFDRTYRNIQAQRFRYELNTYDIDIQHNILIGERNKLVYGAGYRLAIDKTESDTTDFFANDFDPTSKPLQLFSGFVQDQISLVPQKLELTLGSKVLHNDYTGLEFHPTVRIAWTPKTKHTLWSAVSRAVRTPTRLDSDLRTISALNDFNSEKVISYELGYRVQPVKNISLSLALYYNHYTDLRGISISTNPAALYFDNVYKAETYGAEFSANIIATSWWKIRGGYNYLHQDFTATAENIYPESYKFDALDPANQFLIQSIMDIAKNFQFDGVVRYVDVIPRSLQGPSVPSVFTFDLRLGYNYKWLTLSVAGSNLADKSYNSTNLVKTSRSLFGKIEVEF